MKTVIIEGKTSYNVSDETHAKIQELCESKTFEPIKTQNMVVSIHMNDPTGVYPIQVAVHNPVSRFTVSSVSKAISALQLARAFVENNIKIEKIS